MRLDRTSRRALLLAAAGLVAGVLVGWATGNALIGMGIVALSQFVALLSSIRHRTTS